MKIELPHFGEIDLGFCENEYPDNKDYIHYAYDYSMGEMFGDDFKFEGRPVDLDVNFTTLSKANILQVKNSLDNLYEITQRGKKYLIDDFNSNGEVKNHIGEWIEYYLNQEPFKGLAEKPFTEETPNELLKKLEIVRIGFYSWDEDHPYIIMDFAFGYEIDSGYRDNMLTIKLNKNHEPVEITSEG